MVADTPQITLKQPLICGLTIAGGAFVAEFVLMFLLEDLRLLKLSVELGAIADGFVLGLIVGGLYLARGLWVLRGSSSIPRRSLGFEAATVCVITMGFEAALHGPLNTWTAELPTIVGSLSDAVVMACVVGLLATWMVYVRLRVAAYGKPPRAFRAASGILILGALLAALFIATMPALNVGNNLLAWDRATGSAYLVNLAGRQRMLSQVIGRQALLPSGAGKAALAIAVETAEQEGARVDVLARDFVAKFVPDGGQAGGLAQVDRIAALRAQYLAEAREWLMAPDAKARDVINARLQKNVDVYLVAVDDGVRSIQRLADDYSRRQVEAIPFRLVLGFVIMFIAALGMILPILRLVSAQQWKLEERRREAQAAAAAKAQFVANISHELRTPLTSVLGYVALLERQAELSEESRRILGRISFGGQALRTSINDLLDFSALEAGQMKIVPRAVDIRALFTSTLAMFEEQVAAKGIALRAVGISDLPDVIVVDPDRLRQVLMNLLSNAIKFVDAGHVELTVDHDAPAGRLRVAVEDTGPGIAEEHIGKLFQRFAQVDESATRRHGGSGLGLAICKGLVEAMGGSVGVKSTVGEGSIFWFSVEVTAGARIDDRADGPLGLGLRQALKGCRVLVVSAEETRRQLIETGLQVAGCEPSGAASARDGLVLAGEQPFDAIVVDSRLSDPGAVEFLQRLREGDGLNANVPVILALSPRSSAPPPGLFDGQVSTPIQPEQLAACLDQVLNSGDLNAAA